VLKVRHLVVVQAAVVNILGDSIRAYINGAGTKGAIHASFKISSRALGRLESSCVYVSIRVRC
jgi:hypothetical protein